MLEVVQIGSLEQFHEVFGREGLNYGGSEQSSDIPVQAYVVCRGPRLEPPIASRWFCNRDAACEAATSQVAHDGGDREVWSATIRFGVAVGVARLRRIVCD